MSEIEQTQVEEMTIDSSESITIEQAQEEVMEESRVTTIDGSQDMSMDGAQVTTIDGSRVITMDGAQITAMNGPKVTTIDGSQVTTMNSAQVTAVDGAQVTAINDSELGVHTAQVVDTDGYITTILVEEGATIITTEDGDQEEGECDVCGGNHATEECPEISLVDAETQKKLMSKAKMTLPHNLVWNLHEDGNIGVHASELIQTKTRFGPYESRRTTMDIIAENGMVFKIFNKDGTSISLDTTDENSCNWMCLVQAATTSSDQNAIAFQIGSDIYFSNTKKLLPGHELKVWYAPHYAKKLGKPAMPDGITSVLLGQQIVLPDLAEEDHPLQISILSDELDPEGEANRKVKEEAMLAKEGDIATITAFTDYSKEMKKQNIACSRCDESFDTAILLARHLREKHLKPKAKGNKVLQCKVCKRRFVDKFTLSRHMKIHGEGVHWPCNICGLKLSRRDVLIVHIKRKHDGLYTEEDLVNIQKEPEIGPPDGAAIVELTDSTVRTNEITNDGDTSDEDIEEEQNNEPEWQPDPNLIAKEETPGETPSRSSRRIKERKDRAPGINTAYPSEDFVRGPEEYRAVVENMKKEADPEKPKRSRGRPKKVPVLVDKGNLAIQALTDVLEGNSPKPPAKKVKVDEDQTEMSKVDVPAPEAVKISCEISESEGMTAESLQKMSDNAIKILNQMTYDLDDDTADQQKAKDIETPKETTDSSANKEVMEGDTIVEKEKETTDISANKEVLDDDSIVEKEKVVDKSLPVKRGRGRPPKKNGKKQNKAHKELLDIHLIADISVENETLSYTCKQCGASENSTDILAMQEHYNSVHCKRGKPKFHCVDCGKDFNRQWSYDRHECLAVEKGEDGLFGCKECKKKFFNAEYLRRHMAAHTGKFKCDVCNKKFARKESLIKHICSADKNTTTGVQELDETALTCDICGLGFLKEANLYRHMGVHTQDYLCGKCARVYSRKEGLIKHLLKCNPDQLTEKEKNSFFPCKFCSKVFCKELGLKNHMNFHAGAFKCFSCGKNFSLKNALDNHQCSRILDVTLSFSDGETEEHVKSTKRKLYRCPEMDCDEKFKQRQCLIEHLEEHKKETHPCSICEKSFDRKADLVIHHLLCSAVKTVEENGFINCETCNTPFSEPLLYQKHCEDHILPFKCNVCQKRFTKPINSNDHPCIQGKPLPCSLCPLTFKNTAMLERHQVIHAPPQFECPDCTKKFYRKDYLNDHNCYRPDGTVVRRKMLHTGVVETSPVTNICDICGKSFMSVGNLNKHVITHGERKFPCKICHKRFHLSINLVYHMRGVHTNKKNYQCYECGKGMKTKNALMAHIKNFHSDTIFFFQCPKCPKSFRQKGNMLKHQLTHSDKRNFTCRFCNKTFKYQEQIHRHEMEHTQADKYKCSHCEKAFALPYQLRRHVVSYHSGMMFVCEFCHIECRHYHTMRRHIQRKHANVKFSNLGEYINSLRQVSGNPRSVLRSSDEAGRSNIMTALTLPAGSANNLILGRDDANQSGKQGLIDATDALQTLSNLATCEGGANTTTLLQDIQQHIASGGSVQNVPVSLDGGNQGYILVYGDPNDESGGATVYQRLGIEGQNPGEITVIGDGQTMENVQMSGVVPSEQIQEGTVIDDNQISESDATLTLPDGRTIKFTNGIASTGEILLPNQNITNTNEVMIPEQAIYQVQTVEGEQMGAIEVNVDQLAIEEEIVKQDDEQAENVKEDSEMGDEASEEVEMMENIETSEPLEERTVVKKGQEVQALQILTDSRLNS
ncbi:unnamed protein product [Owenia fusiformis]|uniref:Uncharacterized protein n=1 Tax=Owenia fusiformis TaxID=6347 RepID=A0A8J1U9C9_OWEFU|nr:unnamed protein product [Owenia fusiformis]